MTARPEAAVHQLSAGNAKHQAAQAAKAEQLVHLRADIHRELRYLVPLADQLAAVAATKQSAGVGVITEEAVELRDKQTKADRAAARGLSPGRITESSLRWLNASSIGTASGQTEAPVTVSATSVSAEILFTLQDHVRRLGKPFDHSRREAIRTENRDGVCAWPRPWYVARPVTNDGDVLQLARELLRLIDTSQSTEELTAIRRSLEHLEEKARDVVRGPARTNFPDPCPWCDRKTLVVHHRDPGRAEMFVRCDGHHRCQCDDTRCPCQRNPHKNRHEWVNSGSATNTVDGRASTSLVSLIARKKELAILEPKAVAALDRIRAMHQPTYEVDGVERRHYVQVGSDVGSDHVCVIDGDDRCDPEYDDHIALACVECRFATEDGLAGYAFWPCPTARACDLDPEHDDPSPTDSPE